MGHTVPVTPIDRLAFAAEDGQPESMFLLGIAYAQGRGVERNDLTAARWFHRAARKGHLRARTSMGYLYATGRGVKYSPSIAYVFLTKAADDGDPLARDLLVKLRRGLFPDQVKRGERYLSNQRAEAK